MKPLFALGAWLAVLCGLATAETGNPPRRPNVILFLVDDMGWMDSGAYGSTYYETPNIDRLATQAMRFTDAYAPSALLADAGLDPDGPVPVAPPHHQRQRAPAASGAGRVAVSRPGRAEPRAVVRRQQELPRTAVGDARRGPPRRGLPHGAFRQVAPGIDRRVPARQARIRDRLALRPTRGRPAISRPTASSPKARPAAGSASATSPTGRPASTSPTG